MDVPGYSKPTHQYGQSFGDAAEVLEGAVGLQKVNLKPADESEDGWAGEGFDIPYTEPEE